MEKKKEIDFENVADRIIELQEILMDGKETVEDYYKSADLVPEGFCLIATQMIYDENKNPTGLKSFNRSGGNFDPVVRQMALIFIDQPMSYARLLFWMEKERRNKEEKRTKK